MVTMLMADIPLLEVGRNTAIKHCVGMFFKFNMPYWVFHLVLFSLLMQSGNTPVQFFEVSHVTTWAVGGS